MPRGEPQPGAFRRVLSEPALWVCLLLIAVDLVVYAPARHHEFTSWDDPVYITRNPQVTAGLTRRGVAWAFTTGYAANWHPLTWLSHMLDATLYGVNPGPHHLTSVILHIGNTLLLFGTLRRMTGQVWRSAVVAGLFGVHPLHVESVAWVAERKDMLSTLFWLLTLWAYAAYARRPGWGRYLAVLVFFGLGLMAKPMLVTLPFVLLLLDVWPLRRLAAESTGGSGPTSPIDRRAALKLVMEKLPLLALTIASSVVTVVVQARGGAVARLDVFPVGQRVANALVSYLVYVGKMFWPTRLAAAYPYQYSLPLWWVVGSALVLIGVSVVALRAARRAPYLPVGWFWYLGTLVPVIGLVQVGPQSMTADRYTYIPLIGLFIVLAWGIPDLLARWPYRRIGLPVAAGLALAACMIVARPQVGYWKTSETLWTHAVEVTHENWFAHSSMGLVRESQGRVDEAIAHYDEALRMRPSYVGAHVALGNIRASQGRDDEAIAHYDEALRYRPDHEGAHNNLAVILARRGRFDEAIAHYTEALRLRPGLVDARKNLGLALAARGRVDEAKREFLEVLRIVPDDPEAHFSVGVLLARQGQLSEAARHLETALRLDPRLEKARRALDDVTSRKPR